MNLRQLAKPHTTPSGVVLHMMPYRTVLVDAAIIELERLVPREDWTLLHNVFVLSEPLTVDIEWPADMTPELQGWKLYWENRNGNAAHNYQAFAQLISATVFNEWWDAYDKTRDRSTDAPDEIQSVPDKDADPE